MVTGANYLLEHQNQRILIDCGLHQGSNFCERHNWESFPYDPKSIAAVFITHAHIDHIGRLPKLVRDGFRGIIYSTPPTKDFAEFMLRDSDHILAMEAERLKKPILFNEDDINKLMGQWQIMEYHKQINVGPFKVIFHNAGHILGSAFVLVEAENEKIIFSGDLGNKPAPIIGPWEIFEGGATYALVESTYGDRLHEEPLARKEILEDLIEDTVRRGGTLLIPAFAMERTQELLFEINELFEQRRVPRVPIFLDSPLAIKLTEVYRKYDRYFTHQTPGMAEISHLFKFPDLKFTLKTEESKAINEVKPPKVIIAGSGMSHGGRILHHEKRYLPDPRSTLLIVGYQANGSLGRQILDGAESVRILGEDVPVRSHIKNVSGYSAHADQAQLLEWLAPMRLSLKKAFMIQGEEPASRALAQRAIDELAIRAEVPEIGQEVVL